MPLEKRSKSGFIDSARLYLKGGRGGNGCLSFRREKFIPFGGPNGGDGGKGGDIYCQVDPGLNTLIELSLHPHWRALDGGNGKGKNLYGRAGEELTIHVPRGTVIRQGETIIADMTDHGQKVLLARGGRGGRGNMSFKSQSNTAPRIAEKGEPGESLTLDLELRLLAEVGLVGLPNAGKSTLLSRISSARPKIADYPFTTLIPSLGVVYHKEKSFAAADIPGLIEGAHQGKGLGDSFLRHVMRTRLLVQLVDPMGFGGMDPAASVKAVAGELEKFDTGLSTKPRIIAVNKSDLPCADAVFKKIKRSFKKHPVFLISAATGKGVSRLLDEMIRVLQSKAVSDAQNAVRHPEISGSGSPAAATENVTGKRLEPAFTINRGGDGILEISGKSLARMVSMTNFALPEAVERLKRTLTRMGVDKALRRGGVCEGDTVRLADMEFEWRENVHSEPERSVSRRRR